MIKTDKVIYRVRTREEYDWLMEKLEADEDEVSWFTGSLPTKLNVWRNYLSKTCINRDGKKLSYASFDFYKNEPDYKDYEFIDVSGLMENEEETDTQDKTKDCFE